MHLFTRLFQSPSFPKRQLHVLGAAFSCALLLASCGGGGGVGGESAGGGSDLDSGSSASARVTKDTGSAGGGLGRPVRNGTIATYSVQQDNISPLPNNDPNASAVLASVDPQLRQRDFHNDLWFRFSRLIPSQSRNTVGEFWVFTDGIGNRDAYVEIDESYYEQFVLGIDALASLPVNDPTGKRLAQTLVHEHGHLFTLSSSQIDYDRSGSMTDAVRQGNVNAINQAIEACGSQAFLLQGCARPTSYVQQFIDAFWQDDLPKWYASLRRGNILVSGLYIAKPGQFVSSYAASNPGEDIAESWLAYVVGRVSSNPRTIAERKVAFFDRFDELRQLKNAISATYAQRYR